MTEKTSPTTEASTPAGPALRQQDLLQLQASGGVSTNRRGSRSSSSARERTSDGSTESRRKAVRRLRRRRAAGAANKGRPSSSRSSSRLTTSSVSSTVLNSAVRLTTSSVSSTVLNSAVKILEAPNERGTGTRASLMSSTSSRKPYARARRAGGKLCRDILKRVKADLETKFNHSVLGIRDRAANYPPGLIWPRSGLLSLVCSNSLWLTHFEGELREE